MTDGNTLILMAQIRDEMRGIRHALEEIADLMTYLPGVPTPRLRWPEFYHDAEDRPRRVKPWQEVELGAGGIYRLRGEEPEGDATFDPTSGRAVPDPAPAAEESAT